MLVKYTCNMCCVCVFVCSNACVIVIVEYVCVCVRVSFVGVSTCSIYNACICNIGVSYLCVCVHVIMSELFGVYVCVCVCAVVVVVSHVSRVSYV